MIIVCPECDSRFVVKASMIGREGRRVRCGKCKYVWFKDADPESIQKEENIGFINDEQLVDKFPDISNVPAITTEEGSFGSKTLVFFTVVGLMLVTAILASKFILLNIPQLSKYYSYLGIFDNSGVGLYEVEVGKNNEGNLIVSGSIKNEAEHDRKLPLLRLSFFAHNGQKLQTKELFFGNKNLKSGEIFAFDN